MNKKITNKYLISALLIGVLFHGTGIFFTLETTYDALIHLFFADHYASNWFEPWSYSWYTGFTVMGYPPLVHQSIGLLSYIGGLKFGLFTMAIICVILFITGVYKFSLLITGKRNIAGYAALVAVFSSSFVETLHIFGQLPSIMGISILMHALPKIYLWIKTGKWIHLVKAFSLMAVTVTSHHVTPIFGMIFFIFPLIGMVIMDETRDRVGSYSAIRLKNFIQTFISLFWRIVKFGFGSLVLIVVCILPYWINTKNNPITQVPIPHGSRDNFLEVTSSGLVFFVIPWGIILFLLPYLFYRYYSKRYLFFGLSLTLLTILGTGGTTPVPKIILGDNAFNILTLDRFTLWASIMALPIFGEFCYRIAEGDLKLALQQRLGPVLHRILGGALAASYIFMCISTMSLGYFRPSQPQKIKMLPILNFLKQDQHDHWRYLPLGFGDQMAWLSAQTNAMTVDGNYHSARRLPELTSRAVERLENSKFRGVEGIGSLQQFLTIPEKYNLKYVFSNDKFYDPILYFCGWQRLRQLENGIMVWEKLNVPPLPNIIPKEDVSITLKLMWGLIPISTIILAFIINIQMLWMQALKSGNRENPVFFNFSIPYNGFRSLLIKIQYVWVVLILVIIGYGLYLFYIKNTTQLSPVNVVKAYYDALDYKEFSRAYSYIDPKSNKTEDQYMLEVAVTDGLLSSYAKMDGIEATIIEHTDSTAKVKAATYWITPLERISNTFYHDVVKRNNKWHLKPLDYDLDIPPDQLLSNNITQFYNHGRRRISSEQTYHEDVLKQPVLEVLSTALIKTDSTYTVVGEIQNVDNVPADVVIKCTLYNDYDEELAVYNAKDQMKHKLMPKEITSFRINFEGIAWLDSASKKPDTFDPNEFTPVDLSDIPTKFNLQCAGNVATSDLYKGVSIAELRQENDYIEGVLFNSGIQEVTIPQLIISYYNNNHELIWVDQDYIKEGIRPQRKKVFSYKLKDLNSISIINNSLDNTFVNGLPNEAISYKVTPNRKKEQRKVQFIPVSGKSYPYIKVEINNYIGAPY
ncbi:MAG: hypothetical protein CL613_00015 [Aquimarina sp.]|nr:hypothetical protein [Aquimarina sp.]